MLLPIANPTFKITMGNKNKNKNNPKQPKKEKTQRSSSSKTQKKPEKDNRQASSISATSYLCDICGMEKWFTIDEAYIHKEDCKERIKAAQKEAARKQEKREGK